jgi:hypothetical protein
VSKLPQFPERDWANLLDEVTENDRLSAREQMSLWEQGLLDGEADAWGRDYVTAMQAALEQREAGRLLKMLDAGLPIPRILLPVLADILRTVHHGNVSGRASKLTPGDEASIRFLFDVMTERDRKSPANARRWLLKSFREKLKDPNLSISTLNRALRSTRPSSLRFALLPTRTTSSKPPGWKIQSAGHEEVADRSDQDRVVQASLDYSSNKSGS